MLSKVKNGAATRYRYNAANQLVSDGTNKYTYDANGNLIQKGSTKYTYNALNLLESWTDGSHTESYGYNANGLLSSISSNDGTTSLTWDILMGEGVVISANANGVETDYAYGLERISAQTGNRKTEYAYDGRGSVAAEVSYNTAWVLPRLLSSKPKDGESHNEKRTVLNLTDCAFCCNYSSQKRKLFSEVLDLGLSVCFSQVLTVC